MKLLATLLIRYPPAPDLIGSNQTKLIHALNNESKVALRCDLSFHALNGLLADQISVSFCRLGTAMIEYHRALILKHRF